MEKKLTQTDDLVIGQALGVIKNAATLLEFAYVTLKEMAAEKTDTSDEAYLRMAGNDAHDAMSNARNAATAVHAMFRNRGEEASK